MQTAYYLKEERIEGPLESCSLTPQQMSLPTVPMDRTILTMPSPIVTKEELEETTADHRALEFHEEDVEDSGTLSISENPLSIYLFHV